MDNSGEYHISFFGEFTDKTLEKEFLNYNMKDFARFIGPITLIFGIFFMLFIVFDYYAIKNIFSFSIILFIRAVVLCMSIIIFFIIKKHNNYKLFYTITAYELICVISFLLIINLYKSVTYMAVLSIFAMTLAIYIIPNKLIYAQLVSIILAISFFILDSENIENMGRFNLFKITAYNILVLIFCNINAYMTNINKRKLFIDRKELLRISSTDSMTNIYNRDKFSEELNWWFNTCRRNKDSLSLIIFDIDNFKKVNDNYGHPTGDSVIKNIVSIVEKQIRSSDIFARWGGDEFVILLPNTKIQEAMVITENIRASAEKSKHEVVLNITCSFGLVELNENDDVESLLKRADNLLYIAKGKGKNTFAYEGQLHTKTIT